MTRAEKAPVRAGTALFAVLAGMSATAAVPWIDPSTVTFDQTHPAFADISYTLSGAPAIVTIDIETNALADATGEWASIGGENVQSLSGAVNKVVQNGDAVQKIRWKARADWGLRRVAAGQIRAVLTAWATNAPPDYMVIGLERENDVRLYAKPDFVPYGIDSDYYKTNAILMRKIPAAGVVWRMGTPPDEEPAHRHANEVPHFVMLTADYYLGVYELTQGQLSLFHGSNPSKFNGEADSPMRPADCLNMVSLRGMNDASDEDENCWPADGHDGISSNCIIYKLRRRCGLDQIDLPTEAQWEYACRAGTVSAFNDGGESLHSVLVNLGWYSGNSSAPSGASEEATEQTHPVGLKKCNKWGLYDMHGNVAEFCIERLVTWLDIDKLLVCDYERGGVTVDPIGLEADKVSDRHAIIVRGGSYKSEYHVCRSGARSAATFNLSYTTNGCRLWAPAVFK